MWVTLSIITVFKETRFIEVNGNVGHGVVGRVGVGG